MKRRVKMTLLSVALLSAVQVAQAAVALDRTRAVFNGDSKSISLNIRNDSTQLPYLAQSWLEDAQGQKVNGGALVVTPPLQRLEGGAKSMIRIQATPAANLLAQDRETLFYFNLREIPPKSEKPNVLQIALQTKIKLFYRPKGIIKAPGAVWQDQLVLHKAGNGYRIENPTAYYITIIGLGGSKSQSETSKFDGVMVAPKSSVQVASPALSTPYPTYINDYGGRPTLKFSCSGERCVVKA